jgi:hypothetical protein
MKLKNVIIIFLKKNIYIYIEGEQKLRLGKKDEKETLGH